MSKLFFCAFMVVFQAFPAFGINYFRCSNTNDCAKVYVGCGRYGSTHKRYKELYEAKARKTDTTAFCLAPTEKDKELIQKGEPLCKKDKCRLVMVLKDKES